MTPPDKPLVLFVTTDARDFALASKRLPGWRLMWMAPTLGAREWEVANRLQPVAVVLSVSASLEGELPGLQAVIARARPSPLVALGLKAQRKALLAEGVSDVLPRPLSYERLDDWLRLARAVGQRAESTPLSGEPLAPRLTPSLPKPTP